MTHGLSGERGLDFQAWAVETHCALADAFLDNLVQPNKGAAADKKNLLSIYLDIFLVWMFPPTLWRNIAGAAFENLEQGLLNPLARHVAGNTNVIRLAPNFVDLVNVNDPDLGPLDIIVCVLEQPEDYVLDIFSYIAGLS